MHAITLPGPIARALFANAAPDADARFHLRGVAIERPLPKQITATATDGHALLSAPVDACTVPPDALPLIIGRPAKVIPAATEHVTIEMTGTRPNRTGYLMARGKIGRTLVQLPVHEIDDTFPDWQRYVWTVAEEPARELAQDCGYDPELISRTTRPLSRSGPIAVKPYFSQKGTGPIRFAIENYPDLVCLVMPYRM